MKLRNKKTGEVRELPDGFFCGDNLKKISEEWEDYEGPKKCWYISDGGEVYGFSDYYVGSKVEEAYREIGNLFESKEEAEQAVEKLKAAKRLKDKGFRFNCYMRRTDWAGLLEVKALENLIDITAYLPKDKIKEMEADLDLLFGGEDE